MKRSLLLLPLVSFFISGCGATWFPDDSNSGGGSQPPVQSTTPILVKSLRPTMILPGTGANMTYTLVNSIGNPAQTGLAFNDLLPVGVTITAASPQCGGTVEAFSHQIQFTGGSLAAGESTCTIFATVTGDPASSFAIQASGITGLGGGLVSSVQDLSLTVVAASQTSDLVVPTDPAGTGVTVFNPSVISVTPGSTTVTYVLGLSATSNASVTANVAVHIVAMDSDGVEIASTAALASDPGNNVPANTTTPVQLVPVTVTVPAADAARINIWVITGLEPPAV